MKMISLLISAALFTGCSLSPSASESAGDKNVSTNNYQKPGSSVALNYVWLQKPGVGQTGKLKVDFKGNAVSHGFAVRYEAENAVSFSGGQKSFSRQHAKQQSAQLSEEVDVSVANDGISYINVFVESVEGGVKLGRAFAIPVSVGNIDQKTLQHPNLVKQEDGSQIIELPSSSR